jgi:hypothetical protein
VGRLATRLGGVRSSEGVLKRNHSALEVVENAGDSVWLGGRDSNPEDVVQRAKKYLGRFWELSVLLDFLQITVRRCALIRGVRAQSLKLLSSGLSVGSTGLKKVTA